jgi:hypothetical protein
VAYLLSVAWLSFGLAFSTPAAKNVEKAFLQNSPRLVGACLVPAGRILIALPAPISFSDQLTTEQAVFLFEDIFSTFETLEFFAEPAPGSWGPRAGFILKARWSFRDRRNRNLYVLQVFFYYQPPVRRTSGWPTRPPGSPAPRPVWKISAIKAASASA